MESKIRIAVDFQDGNRPVVEICKKSSEDVRDSLVAVFLESFPNSNRWCRIEYTGENTHPDPMNPTFFYRIVPIKKSEIEAELTLMQAYLESLPK